MPSRGKFPHYSTLPQGDMAGNVIPAYVNDAVALYIRSQPQHKVMRK